MIVTGNDITTEGLLEFEDGTEMDWTQPFWFFKDDSISADIQDGVVFSTRNDWSAGIWFDAPLTNSYWYICEKNSK